MIPALVIAALLAIAAFGKGEPIPCAPQTCTAEQIAEQDPLPPVTVDMGPHRDGKVR